MSDEDTEDPDLLPLQPASWAEEQSMRMDYTNMKYKVDLATVLDAIVQEGGMK